MRDFYRFLIAVFTAPDLRWQTPVYTGLGVGLVVGVALPVLLPWTGFFALALETLAVVAGVGGGLALIGYGGWLLVFGNRMDRLALEEVEEDEPIEIETEAVGMETETMDIETESASAPAPEAGEGKVVRPTRPVGQVGQVCPICPKCLGPMMRARARAGHAKGREFWVCHQYPDCQGLRAMIVKRRRS